MRPAFHLAAPTNWMNDPNGLIQWRGVYHVFYQHHPRAPRFGRMQWGHASSPDLLHWMDHGPALVPSDDGPDRDGCWSGSIVVIDGTPTAFYTGASGSVASHAEAVCRAFSDHDLTVWRKDPSNPLIPGGPRPGGRYQRDPFVVRRDDRWLMLLGSGVPGAEEGVAGGGAVVAYESTDLRTWHDRGTWFTRPAGVGPIDTGPVWEVPQLIRVADRWVLIVSIQRKGDPHPVCEGAVWFIGDFKRDRFESTSMGWLDGGDVFYAPAVLRDASDRHLVWGWLQDPTPDLGVDDVVVGSLSVPRVLELAGDRVVTRPAPELDGLPSTSVAAIAELDLDAAGVATAALGDPGAAARVRFRVRDLRGTVGTRIAGGPGGGRLVVGVERTDDSAVLVIERIGGGATPSRLASPIPTVDEIAVDVIIDGSIVEAFAAGAAVTSRIPPDDVGDRRTELVALRGRGHVADAELIAIRG